MEARVDTQGQGPRLEELEGPRIEQVLEIQHDDKARQSIRDVQGGPSSWSCLRQEDSEDTVHKSCGTDTLMPRLEMARLCAEAMRIVKMGSVEQVLQDVPWRCEVAHSWNREQACRDGQVRRNSRREGMQCRQVLPD
jgi:hypothetical protein